MTPKKKVSQTVLTDGKFYTISAANGKVVEVADYNIDNGAKIQLWDNVNAEWQQWNFVAAGDGVYRIQNRFTGKMLDLDCGGVSDGTDPNGLVTREQFATMLYRYAGSPAAGGMAISEFTDGASVSDYATDAVTWALSEGILTGMGDGILAPQGTATRAQAAAMLMRFVER